MKIIVEYHHPGARLTEFYVCDQADSRAHAIDQTLDAEPGALIVNVYKPEKVQTKTAARRA